MRVRSLHRFFAFSNFQLGPKKAAQTRNKGPSPTTHVSKWRAPSAQMPTPTEKSAQGPLQVLEEARGPFLSSRPCIHSFALVADEACHHNVACSPTPSCLDASSFHVADVHLLRAHHSCTSSVPFCFSLQHPLFDLQRK